MSQIQRPRKRAPPLKKPQKKNLGAELSVCCYSLRNRARFWGPSKTVFPMFSGHVLGVFRQISAPGLHCRNPFVKIRIGLGFMTCQKSGFLHVGWVLLLLLLLLPTTISYSNFSQRLSIAALWNLVCFLFMVFPRDVFFRFSNFLLVFKLCYILNVYSFTYTNSANNSNIASIFYLFCLCHAHTGCS